LRLDEGSGLVGGEEVFGAVQELLAAGPMATFELEHGLVVDALKCPATKSLALGEVSDAIDEFSAGTLLGAATAGGRAPPAARVAMLAARR
jgi:hypothetical protein